MVNKPDKTPKEDQWIDPYTKQHLLSPDIIAALKGKLQEDPNADLAPIAGACLVELYKEQFTVTPAIAYNYQKPFDTFQSSFILIPAKSAVGGMRAWNSMATVLDQLNQRSPDFGSGNDLILVAPPARRDGRMHVSVRNAEELVKLVRAQRPDIYERAETNLRQGVNYLEGGKGVAE